MPSAAHSTRRIVIVEDDPMVREHFIEIISGAPDFDIAGVAENLRQAHSLISLKPELFLIDIGLPDGSGLDFIPEIKAGCEARILVVTSFADKETVVAAIEAGADGYLLKDSSTPVILDGISVTLDGGAPISAAAAVFLLEHMRAGARPLGPQSGAVEALTPREIELLKLFAKGSSYKEAARELGISPLTVGNHVKSIYRKLAVHSRGEAVFAAVRAGKLDLG
jgi:DNA-binding NarL/FixJ family response regulator